MQWTGGKVGAWWQWESKTNLADPLSPSPKWTDNSRRVLLPNQDSLCLCLSDWPCSFALCTHAHVVWGQMKLHVRGWLLVVWNLWTSRDHEPDFNTVPQFKTIFILQIKYVSHLVQNCLFVYLFILMWQAASAQITVNYSLVVLIKPTDLKRLFKYKWFYWVHWFIQCPFLQVTLASITLFLCVFWSIASEMRTWRHGNAKFRKRKKIP